MSWFLHLENLFLRPAQEMSSSQRESLSAAKAAAATTSLSAFTSLPPNRIPLLIADADGSAVRQINVPVNASISDIKSQLSAAGIGNGTQFDLSFGNTLLEDQSTLDETRIADAYNHAGSMLRIIQAGDLEPNLQQQALESTCAVVKQVSNGFTGMEDLCAAAMRSGDVISPSIFSDPAGASFDFSTPSIDRPMGRLSASNDTAQLIDGGQSMQSPIDGGASGALSDFAASNDFRRDGDASGCSGSQPATSRTDSGEFRMLDTILSQQATPHNPNSHCALNPAAIRGQHPVLADRGIVLGGDGSGVPAPNSFVLGLSRRLPDLFKPSATDFLFGSSSQIAKDFDHQTEQNAAQHGENSSRVPDKNEQGGRSPGSNPVAVAETLQVDLQNKCSVSQPSISTIRAIRQLQRQRRANSDCTLGTDSNSPTCSDALRPSAASDPRHEAHLSGIGHSTGNIGDVGGASDQSTEHRFQPRTGEAILAGASSNNWLDDVMKTWEVNLVRRSGVLESTENGAQINDYLQLLEHESQTDVRDDVKNSPSLAEQTEHDSEGDSSEAEGSDDCEDNVLPFAGLPSASGSYPTTSNQHQQVFNSAGADSARNAQERRIPTHNYALVENAPPTTDVNAKQGLDPSARALPIMSSTTGADPRFVMSTSSGLQIVSIRDQHLGMNMATARLPQSQFSRDLSLSSQSSASSAPSLATSAGAQGIRVGIPPLQPQMQARQILPRDMTPSANKPPHCAPRLAPRIAPAPDRATVSNQDGGLGASTSAASASALYASPGSYHQQSTHLATTKPGPKKRGRKRRNPELSEDERALLRKQQNRESAKLSRVRRKVIAAEYEEQIADLVNKNESLKNQVSSLNNRLSVLQNLLTVYITPQERQSIVERSARAQGDTSRSGTSSDTSRVPRAVLEGIQESAPFQQSSEVQSASYGAEDASTTTGTTSYAGSAAGGVTDGYRNSRGQGSSEYEADHGHLSSRKGVDVLQTDGSKVAEGTQSVTAHV